MDASGKCTVCPKNCSWNLHENTRHRYGIEEKTYNDLKAKYDTALKGKFEVETIINGMEKEMQQLNDVVYDMIDEARIIV